MRRKIVPQIGDFETWFTQLPRSRRGRARRQLCRSRRWACADELRGSGNPRMRHCSRNAIAGAVCRNPRRTALHTHEKLSRGEQCSFAASRTPPWLASGWGQSGPVERNNSLRQSYPAQKVGKARIRAETIEEWVNSEEYHTGRSLFDTLV